MKPDKEENRYYNRYYTTIIVPGDVQVSFENSRAPRDDEFAVIISLHDNIHFPGNFPGNNKFRGLIYAPEGMVTIDNGNTIEGNVIAQRIWISMGNYSFQGGATANTVHHETKATKRVHLIE